MHIGQIMTRKVVTIAPDSGVKSAHDKMMKGRFAHLPVMKGQKLVGMLSDRDLRQAIIPRKILKGSKIKSPKLSDFKVRDLMTTGVITADPGMSVTDAVKLILRLKIGALPVMASGKLGGIVSKGDLLGIFVEMLQSIQSSSTIDVEFLDEIDDMDALFYTFNHHKAKILSYSATPGGEGHRQICHIRLDSCPVKPIVRDLEKRGVKVLDAYGIDT
ncbi:hypothetical protein MNBD_NITROSPINAE04-1143 [hydrothermal vent metagenome]|uniref:CBS domain-containing protein n=1 Tax=hydrothermal vent metagenome TaxID=652676 RepID=A0A3B1D188_9ZZZZ